MILWTCQSLTRAPLRLNGEGTKNVSTAVPRDMLMLDVTVYFVVFQCKTAYNVQMKNYIKAENGLLALRLQLIITGLYIIKRSEEIHKAFIIVVASVLFPALRHVASESFCKPAKIHEQIAFFGGDIHASSPPSVWTFLPLFPHFVTVKRY